MDEEFVAALQAGELDLSAYLFLEPSEQIKRHWEVNSFDKRFRARLDTLSRHGAVSLLGLPALIEEAESEGYEVVFTDDPTPEFEWLARLEDDPGVTIPDILTGKPRRDAPAFLRAPLHRH